MWNVFENLYKCGLYTLSVSPASITWALITFLLLGIEDYKKLYCSAMDQNIVVRIHLGRLNSLCSLFTWNGIRFYIDSGYLDREDKTHTQPMIMRYKNIIITVVKWSCRKGASMNVFSKKYLRSIVCLYIFLYGDKYQGNCF